MATKDDEAAFLAKLEKVVDDALQQKGVAHFTPEEGELLKRVAARERAWASIGALAGSAKTIVTWLGFMLAAWAALKAGFISWIADALGMVK
jgi:hypothetical protein